MNISKNNKENINYIKEKFGNSSDIVIRDINDISYIFLDSVSSDDKIGEFLNKCIDNINSFNNLFNTLKNSIYSSNVSTEDNYENILYKLSSGYTIIFINGYNKSITIETRTKLDRGVNESTSEGIIRGPKDSFTENHIINIGLVRKRIKTNDLWIDNSIVGERSKTIVSVLYINGIAKKKIINKIKKIINNINIDGILDSGYIKEFIQTSETSFPEILSTERPDLVSGALLEGKIVILVENSPFALILPALLVDFIHAQEDYYQDSVNSSFTRLIRLLSFILTIITPAFYIAVTTWNQEVIPNELLISLSLQKIGVPFPTTFELLIMITTFEILREADIRIPNASGASISIVGALILGEAAVSAGVVSPIVIIVVAFTSISAMVFTDIDFINSIRYWRLIFIIFASLLGFIGIVIAFLLFLTKICSLEMFDIPYTTPTSPLVIKMLRDSFIRSERTKQKYRAPYLTKNTKKLGD